MLLTKQGSLRSSLLAGQPLPRTAVCSTRTSAEWSDIAVRSVLGCQRSRTLGRAVVLATSDQLTTIAALFQLDGTASGVVLYPPDLPIHFLSYVARGANAKFVISDRVDSNAALENIPVVNPASLDNILEDSSCDPELATEWILLTSGTTGLPKMVVHTLESLTGAIPPRTVAHKPVVWSTFYDMRRYGGLQIFLRAALTGSSLVVSDAPEPISDFLGRAADQGVTHISGTPTHWRRALMSPAARLLNPEYVRLSGEIADQSILDQLQAFYPQARVAHAFASTEAGVGFEVNDGLAGFPAAAIQNTPGVEMKVVNGSLHIRSPRTASRYLDQGTRPLRDEEGFVDTVDLLELRGDRYYFAGRADGVINVGGLKVHPEEVEAVINRHPDVRMSLVRSKKSPITGALVVADVVLKHPLSNQQPDGQRIQQEILSLCKQELSPHKVPVRISFVADLTVAETGKLVRGDA